MTSEGDEGFRDYPIGYGVPPLATRFQKGKSGNPNGRPPRKKTRRTILEQVALREIAVAEGGRHKEATVLEVIIMIVKSKAIAGSAPAARLCDKLRGLDDDDVEPVAKGVLILGEELSQEEWEEKFVPKLAGQDGG